MNGNAININSKSRFAIAKHRDKILNESIFGIWADPFNTIEFKIAPDSSYARVKIIEVKDISAMERISFFCGLDFLPKRTRWRGFDFITHLVQSNMQTYKNGLVHMPNAKRTNCANMIVVNAFNIVLEFYFAELIDHEFLPRHVGYLPLVKKKTNSARNSTGREESPIK